MRLGTALRWSGFCFCFLLDIHGADTTLLEVDKDRSRISARVQATGHSFDAVVTAYDIDLKIDPNTGAIAAAVLSFDFSDVETGRDKRDREMRDWLEYATHPTARFALAEITTGEEGTFARGELVMHGVSKKIEFPIVIERMDDGIRITGETIIDHRDWKLDRIRAFLFMTVDPDLEVSFDLYFPASESRGP